MPYRNHQGYVEWSRRYQQRRSEEGWKERVSLEQQVLALVRQHPGVFDAPNVV